MNNKKKQETELAPNARYGQIADRGEIQDIQAIMSRMVSGGFSVTSGRGSRQLTDKERFVIAVTAARYGLDPLMGEIYLLGDKPYVSTKALMRVAVESGRMASSWRCRPMTKDERTGWQLADGEIGVIAEIAVKGIDDKFVGVGTARVEDVGILRRKNGYHDDQRIVRKQAQTRAIRDVLSQAFGVASTDKDDVQDASGFVSIDSSRTSGGASQDKNRPSLSDGIAALAREEKKPDHSEQPSPQEILISDEELAK